MTKLTGGQCQRGGTSYPVLLTANFSMHLTVRLQHGIAMTLRPSRLDATLCCSPLPFTCSRQDPPSFHVADDVVFHTLTRTPSLTLTCVGQSLILPSPPVRYGDGRGKFHLVKVATLRVETWEGSRNRIGPSLDNRVVISYSRANKQQGAAWPYCNSSRFRHHRLISHS